MAYNANKMLSISILAWVMALYAPAIAAAESELTMQPQGLNQAGIYALKQLDPTLTGSGVKFAVICRSITYTDGEPQNDYRPSVEHNCFNGKELSFYDQGELPAGVSPHSTAICSILLGEDPNASDSQLGQFNYQGVAAEGEADIYEFWHFLINNVFSNTPPEADVVTTSIGNQFEDWWTRGFESLAEQHGLVIVAGIGNGSNTYDPTLYPGAGSNVIGVGVINSVNTEDLAVSLANFSLAYPEHSSAGPTANGRCKPDIVTVGNCLAANANEPNRYEPTGNWSSFSTPIVAGTIGLLRQKAKQDPNLSAAVDPNSGNCVMKAILMNSATKLAYWHKGKLSKDDDHQVPLDYIQGAGALNAVGAYKHLIAKQADMSQTGWNLNQLEKNEGLEKSYKIVLQNPADKLIIATTVWNKHYSNVYPFEAIPEKDANLRLEVWAVDANDPNNDYLLDYSDSSIDNVEHVYCQADPNYTDYEITVVYSDTDDPNKMVATQAYAAAWNVSEKQNDKDIGWYDLNADGIVNELDFEIMFKNLTSSSNSSDGYLLGDINTNGTIDVNDLQILLSYNNQTADWLKEDISE